MPLRTVTVIFRGKKLSWVSMSPLKLNANGIMMKTKTKKITKWRLKKWMKSLVKSKMKLQILKWFVERILSRTSKSSKKTLTFYNRRASLISGWQFSNRRHQSIKQSRTTMSQSLKRSKISDANSLKIQIRWLLLSVRTRITSRDDVIPGQYWLVYSRVWIWSKWLFWKWSFDKNL